MVSFPSRDKERLFTTASAPVSGEDTCGTGEVLTGANLFPMTHVILREGPDADLKQPRGTVTAYTLGTLSNRTRHVWECFLSDLAVPVKSHLAVATACD